MGQYDPILTDINLAVGADVDAAVAASAGLRLVGYAARETAGGVAQFRIVNGATGGAGALLAPISLPADGSAMGWFGEAGIPSIAGLSIDYIAGTFEVTLLYKIATFAQSDPILTDTNVGIVADVDGAVAPTAGLRLVGFIARETAGAAAAFRIVNGATGAGGQVLVPVSLAANGSQMGWFGEAGIPAAAGLSIDRIAGTIDVVLLYRTAT